MIIRERQEFGEYAQYLRNHLKGFLGEDDVLIDLKPIKPTSIKAYLAEGVALADERKSLDLYLIIKSTDFEDIPNGIKINTASYCLQLDEVHYTKVKELKHPMLLYFKDGQGVNPWNILKQGEVLVPKDNFA